LHLLELKFIAIKSKSKQKIKTSDILLMSTRIKRMIYLNGRFLTQQQTGTQRNAYELTIALLKLTKEITILVPPVEILETYDTLQMQIKIVGKNKSSLWEQIDLAFFMALRKGALLVNLTNTAPYLLKHQIVSIMDMAVFVNPKWFNWKFSSYYKWLVPRISKRSSLVVTISNSSKFDIIKYTGIPESKIKIINCAVPSKFHELIKSTSLEDTKVLLDKYGIQQGNFFLAVSSLDPRKNFLMLLEAYKLSESNVPLLIVGRKNKTFADSNLDVEDDKSDIKFTGYISDEELVILYKSAMCFIYPSLYEGFGIPPLEAMACGCPTVVSNIASLPEVCGLASVFIDPHNKEEISEAIKNIANDENLRNRLVNAGFDQVGKFNWDKSAKLLLEKIIEHKN
jgi:glycosyltransferase involved in cell wall biosynthesis